MTACTATRRSWAAGSWRSASSIREPSRPSSSTESIPRLGELDLPRPASLLPLRADCQRRLLLNNDFPYWTECEQYPGSGNFLDLPFFARPARRRIIFRPPIHRPSTVVCRSGRPFARPAPDVGVFELGQRYTPQPAANLVAFRATPGATPAPCTGPPRSTTRRIGNTGFSARPTRPSRRGRRRLPYAGPGREYLFRSNAVPAGRHLLLPGAGVRRAAVPPSTGTPVRADEHRFRRESTPRPSRSTTSRHPRRTSRFGPGARERQRPRRGRAPRHRRESPAARQCQSQPRESIVTRPLPASSARTPSPTR